MSLLGRTDSVIMLDELRTLHMNYNRMSTGGITAEMAVPCATGAVRKIPLYQNFVEIDQEVATVKLDDFEANTLKLCYGN